MAHTRREFLRAGVLATLGLGVTSGLSPALAAPVLPRQRRRARSTGGEPVLVTVLLSGGNDGLNTVVPLAQYDRYRALRPTLGWEREVMLALPGYADDFAVNAGLGPLLPLFAQGKMAIVNGVGYPPGAQGEFNHEGSQVNLQTADTHGLLSAGVLSGWLGRYLDSVAPGELPGGIDFGRTDLMLRGLQTEPLSLTKLSEFGVEPSGDTAALYRAYAQIQGLPTQPGVMQRSALLRRQVVALSGTLGRIAGEYEVTPGVTYPSGDVGTMFRDTAALIAADQGVRCLGLDFGYFDTHSGQNGGPPNNPLHQALLNLINTGIAALYADLVGHGVADRVLILVTSEFGRRAFENSLLGTDHGLASVAMLLGESVKPGVHGDYPDLRDEFLVLDGNLAVHTDFRSVYSTILAKHFGVDPQPIVRGPYPQLAFL